MGCVKYYTSKNKLEKIIDIVFPVFCVSCQKEGDWICRSCLKNIDCTSDTACRICRKYALDGICQSCKKNLKIDKIISPFSYSHAPIKNLIKQGKFLGHRDIFVFLSRLVKSYVLTKIIDQEATVSYIPLSSARKKEREFDQAKIIAEEIFGQDEIKTLVVKHRHTPPQAQCQAKERAKNILSAYKIKNRPTDTAIICDDVVTSGSSAKEVSKVLRRNGVKQIILVTLAHK